MGLDLTAVQNNDWENVFAADRVVEYNVDSQNQPLSYTPIENMFVALDKHVLLIGISSEINVKPWWFLGGRASQYLYLSPSSTPNLSLGVQACEQKRLKINSMTLVQFQNFGIAPYVLLIEIPYWLEQVHVEVWKYLGFEDNAPATTNNANWDGGIYP